LRSSSAAFGAVADTARTACIEHSISSDVVEPNVGAVAAFDDVAVTDHDGLSPDCDDGTRSMLPSLRAELQPILCVNTTPTCWALLMPRRGSLRTTDDVPRKMSSNHQSGLEGAVLRQRYRIGYQEQTTE